MKKNRFLDDECPIARALSEIGDGWTLLIIREAMYGTDRFEGFLSDLNIARNILSDRLKRLVDVGIFTKQADPNDGRSSVYSLTGKGRALWSVLVSLMTWSNRWVAKTGKHKIDLQDKDTGRKIAKLCALDANGEPIDLRNAILVSGPGASSRLRQRVTEVAENNSTHD